MLNYKYIRVKKIIKTMQKRVFLVITIVIMFGGLTGFLVSNDTDFKIAKNLDIFFTLFRELNMFYVDETDPEKLVNDAIEGMLESLDPYTTFIPESEMENFTFMTTGEYGGIGALIRRAGDYTIVSEPYSGFPAQKTGLQAGDTIIEVDGVSTKGLAISKVSEMLKGTPNTPVKIKIKRYGINKPMNKELMREKVSIKNVPYYGMVKDSIGYIRLANFTSDAGKEVSDAVIDLKQQNAKGIILDIRNNPGGLLIEAVAVANIFIDQDKEIVSTRGKVSMWDKEYTTPYHAIDTTIPLVVLVSRGSASASEIVAGAIQDYDRGVIVGDRTFGKGLVQTSRPLSYNTKLKVTTAKYYIPSGRCIQALDYSNRNEDGSVGKIPDSLISEFTTRNGRLVYDGGGITPDIKIPMEKPGKITYSLYAKNFIFSYATIYTATHDSVPPPEQMTFSEEDYTDFLAYIANKDFDYTTQSDDKLKELIKSAKKEKYYSIAQKEFDALQEKLKHDKNKDLQTFKEEIKELLAEEISSRYYYQEGRLITSLLDDIQLDKAVYIMDEEEIYAGILTGDYTEPNNNTENE